MMTHYLCHFSESHPEVPALVRVTQCVQEWYTVETVRLIYGNKFLRQLLTENDFATPDLPEEDEIARSEIPDEVSLEVRARYIRLCQQLDMLEIKVIRKISIVSFKLDVKVKSD